LVEVLLEQGLEIFFESLSQVVLFLKKLENWGLTLKANRFSALSIEAFTKLFSLKKLFCSFLSVLKPLFILNSF